MVPFVKKLRQPVEVKKPDGVGKKLCDSERPCLLVSQELLPGNLLHWFRGISLNVFELCGANMGMMRGTVILGKPPADPNCAKDARCQKSSTPAEFQNNPLDESWRHNR